jgi:hypothetical protein
MNNLDATTSQSKIDAAQKVANFIASVISPQKTVQRTGYCHMGATLTDTVLQAGLNYRSVVLPRVQHVLSTYPQAGTTSSFWRVLCDVGPETVLRWSHPEKIERLTRLVDLLLTKNLETETELATWFCTPNAHTDLLSLKGVGPKTVDYLKILVGVPSVAIDRHVKTLFRIIGLDHEEYDDVKSVVCSAADILKIQPHTLDGIIWEYMSIHSRQFAKRKQ